MSPGFRFTTRLAIVASAAALFPSACGGDGNSSRSTLGCQQKAGSDTDADCVGHPGKPRKLDCDASQTQSAVNAGCEPTGPGESDVCCPLSVRGTPEGTTGATTVNCQQKPDADGNPDCAGHPGKTRKLDCDAVDTQSAVSAGCEPQSAGASDVCCPTSVSGILAP